MCAFTLPHGVVPKGGLTPAEWLARLDLMAGRAARRECVFTGRPVRQAYTPARDSRGPAVCHWCGATAERGVNAYRANGDRPLPAGWGKRWYGGKRPGARNRTCCPACLPPGRAGQ